MSKAVHEILERIQRLPAAERVELEDCLAQQADAEWQREAEEARNLARKKASNRQRSTAPSRKFAMAHEKAWLCLRPVSVNRILVLYLQNVASNAAFFVPNRVGGGTP